MIAFMDMIYPWCLWGMTLHLKYMLFLHLDLFSAYGISKMEFACFVVWFPHIGYFPFLNLREQSVGKSVSWCYCSESLLLKCFIFDAMFLETSKACLCSSPRWPD